MTSYIGNQPIYTSFVTDTFSGNGSNTVFTMQVAPASSSSIIVSISGAIQNPSTYSVNGLTLTFSVAPASGTNNISVRYLGIPASGITNTAYRTVTEFTATAGQTTFTVPSYTVGYVDVYRNGVKLGAADFTATSGTTVVLNIGANLNNLITIVSFYVSSVLNAMSQSGGAFNGDIVLNNGSANGIAYLNNGKVLTTGSALTFDGTNLLVGTTTQIGRITSWSTSGSAGQFYVNASATTATPVLILGKYDNNSTTSQVFVQFQINQLGSGSGQINANGASSAAFGSYSDSRLKEHIKTLSKQLDRILALKPCEFDYKDGSGHQIGFVAQEMQEVYPDVVSEGSDGMLMITGWSKTEARLVKAIQEQQELINQLKSDNTDILARLKSAGIEGF